MSLELTRSWKFEAGREEKLLCDLRRFAHGSMMFRPKRAVLSHIIPRRLREGKGGRGRKREEEDNTTKQRKKVMREEQESSMMKEGRGSGKRQTKSRSRRLL